MDPTDFVNSSETRLAVSRIITWTTEPKSSDVRKVGRLLLTGRKAGKMLTVQKIPAFPTYQQSKPWEQGHCNQPEL